MISWIAPETLDGHIEKLKTHAMRAADKASERREENVVDPFSSLLIATTFGAADRDQLTRLQDAESALRGMSNALGSFHQNVLASIEGWANHDAGYDLECSSRRLLAEVKNKWNTMNTANRREVVRDLETAIRQRRDWHAYLVLVIPKTPNRYMHHIAPRVSEIDGASFYHKATGDPNALHELFDYLCDAISPSEDIARHCRQVMAQSLPPKEI